MADHPNKLAFEEGVSYIFHNWTALKLAVEQDWGGVESAEKREWMIDLIVGHFDKRKSIFKKHQLDIDEIEDILSQIMTDEFNATLEDDSPYLVAKHLVLLYGQCVKGDFSEVERLREKAKLQNSFTASSCNQQPEDKDDDMDEVPEEPTVDADGWEIVRRK
ncbi:hypothetical protein INT48_006366 [Thamnidium elegans]|uniref:Pre-rRNA-processing protein TSR2 n=1 Tax=Thamnidium elegans TaxID=101142 RepID=A0A8H7VS40_9FUNG|nr:hypothetical protein INT48_006366 [Thamnidium elegans]